MPLVSAGEPEEVESYNRFEENGIKVFVHRDVDAVDGVLRFKLRRFLFLKEIEVEGVKVI
jgi:hypothetical protein